MTHSNDPDEIRAEIERTRSDLSNNVGLLEEKVTPSKIVDRRVQKARGAVFGVKDKVMGSAQHASDAGSSGLDSVRSAFGSTTDTVTSAPSTVTDKTAGNPLAAGLIAFGIGYLASSLFSPSDGEQRLAAKVKDTAQPAISNVAQQVAGDLKEPAQQAVAQVKDAATQAGSEVADHATSATAEVKDHATSATTEVKDHATSAAQDVKDTAHTP